MNLDFSRTRRTNSLIINGYLTHLLATDYLGDIFLL